MLLGALVVAVGYLTGCASDVSGVKQPPIAMVASFDHSPALPGDRVSVTITATPDGRRQVDYIRVIAHGLLARTDSVPLGGVPGARSTVLQYWLPGDRTGTLSLSITGGAGDATSTIDTSLVSQDSVPPSIGSATAAASAHLDTIRVIAPVTDNAGIAAVAVHFAGTFTAVDSFPAGFHRSVRDSVAHPVPPSADFSKPLTVMVDAYDVGGHHVSAQLGTMMLRDEAPPVLQSVLLGPTGQPATLPSSAAYRPGDVMSIQLAATDNVQLAWVGYRIGAPVGVADSVAVSAASYSGTSTLTIQSAWLGAAPVTFFAVDARGNRTENSAPMLSVYKIASPTIRDAAIPGGIISDAVFDPKRHVVYLAQPDSDRVLVLSTSTMSFQAPIATPGYPKSVDLSASGDSLIVALRHTTTLGVVDLTTTGAVMTTIPLYPPTTAVYPFRVRVSSRGMAVITMDIDGSGWASMLEYDLGTHQVRTRSDVGDVQTGSELAVSGDRSTLVQLSSESCCPNYALRYTAATDAFSGSTGTTDTYGASISIDGTGARTLIASSLYDASLARVAVFDPPNFNLAHDYVNGTTPTAIAPAGDVAYISTGSAVYVVRLADGAVLQDFALPVVTTRLLPVENGTALLSIGAYHADLVQLP